MKNKLIFLGLLLLIVSNAFVCGSGEGMPSLVEQTYNDIAREPQDFGDEETETEVEGEDEESEGEYVDEFDDEADTPNGLDEAPACRRRCNKNMSWYQNIFETALTHLMGFRV